MDVADHMDRTARQCEFSLKPSHLGYRAIRIGHFARKGVQRGKLFVA
jgi:hypothetical protein